jgi:sulfite exporter TauE/SafE
MTLYWTAFLLGIGGSFHCLGMCAPLVMAVTGIGRGNIVRKKIIYNSGRIFTYAVLGGLVGWLGSALNWTAYQDIISVLSGLVLILFALAGVSQIKIPVITPILQWLTLGLKKQFSKFLAVPGYAAMFSTGMINGLLPCGLTYLALTSCLAVSNATQGIIYMSVFGAGTLGVMLGFSVLMDRFIIAGKFNLQKITVVSVLLAGTLLIIRAFFNHATHIDHAGSMTILCN